MKLKDNSTQEIDTALYQLEQKLKSNIRLTDVENSNASTAKINAVDKKLTEEVKDRQSADEKLQDNINKEVADRQDADAAIENAKQDKLIAGNNIQIDGNVISATSKEYTAEAPVKVTDGKISLDTVPVTKGGTGVTTQADINKAFINNLEIGNSDVTDGTEFVSSYASDNGFADPSAINKPYKRQFIKVWNYIKDKISSVLGLTSEKVSSYDSHLTNKDNPHSVTKSQVGLGSVVNTGDSATPVSGGTTKFTTGGAYTELNKKVDKVNGKGLSSNDFTDTYKDKLDNIDTAVTAGSSNLVTSGAVATSISTEVTNRNTAITNAINNLDVSSVGGDGKYISAISETDGKISATSTTMDTVPTANSVKAVTSGGIKTAISTAETNAKNLANATGTLAVANGGTGETTANAAADTFINSLPTGTDVPVDADYYVCQAAGGGTIDTRYCRRPMSKLWEYIKGKISSVLGLTKDTYGGNSATATTADSAKNMYSQTLDLSKLDKTKFYPVFCFSGENFAEVAVFSTGGSGSAEYNQNRIHFDISTQGWTDEPFTLNIREYACFDNKEITIGCIGRGLQDGGWAIWLRGGRTYSCFTRNCKLSLKTSDYTYGAEKYTVGTNYYGGKNNNVKVEFTPQSTITNGSYSSRPITAPGIKATMGFTGDLKGNVTGNVTGNVSGSSGSCTGKAAKSSFLDEYPGAGGTRPTSLNIVPKDASEYGGMRKDVVTDSVTDSGRPDKDGHLLTMFWDNSGRFDSQFFVSNEKQPVLKARGKGNETDYGEWVDIITSNNIGSQTVANATNARTAADAGYLCKLYQLANAIQTYNVILLGKIPDPASTEAPATPSASWDIDVDFYFVRPQGHKAAWCNVKAGYGYSNAWRKYGLIETFGVDNNTNYSKPFYLVTLKYNNEYYIGVRHTVDIDGSYAARVKYVNTRGNRNPSTVDNTPLVNMLKVIPYQKTTDGTVLNSEIKTSIADFPNTYAPAVERNGDLLLKSGYVRIGASGVAGSKLTIQGATENSNSYTDTNPKLEFKNNDGSQNISLTFTDWDTVQAPASLTLNGNQGDEYFIAPNIKATTKFIGNLTGNVTGNVSGSSGSAAKLTTARKAYVDLGTASTTTSVDWSGDTTIPVNGVLSVEHGGTGQTTANGAANSFINSLTTGESVPEDNDYFISQYVNGGTTTTTYHRRPVSKLWEYIKGKISQEGEDFGYNHIVHDDASLLEWANCTDGHMKKVLVKSGRYNMTKGVDFSKAGTGYVFAENGAVINSKVPIAFSAPSGKTAVHNLSVICGPSSDNSCAFSANDVLNLILYDCEAGYATNTVTVNRNLFSKCTCYNCHYNFTYSSSNSSMSIKVFYQCYCYNCICKQTIAANSSSAVSFATESFFYKECVCVSCDAELTILRNIKAATPSFYCYYNCWDRCVGCLSKINVNSSALTVYSTLYGFMRCQHMSSCKEVHTVGYSNIKGVVQCIYISSTSAVSGESNTGVGNSCDI